MVGTARRDVSPTDLKNLNPTGGDFTAIHDPLHLRVVVLDDGVTVVAIAALDVIEVGDMGGVQNRIETELGIPADNVLIVGSHSHNAPRVGLVSPGALALASRPEFETYGAMVFDALVDALRDALKARRPARVAAGAGCVDVNVNRDLYSRGSWIQGRNDEGPSDKTLRVLRLEEQDGTPLAMLLNYSMHCTVAIGTNEVSGDVAAFACSYAEQRLGSKAIALWIPGALGDQNPRIRYSDFLDQGDADPELAWSVVAAQGTMIGAEAMRVSQAQLANTVHAVRLHVERRFLHLPTQEGIDDRDDHSHGRVDFVEIPISLLCLNEIALCGVGGEVVEGVAAAIRASSPLRNTWIASLVNNRVGYIATDDAYPRRTFEAVRAPVAEGFAQDELVRAFTSMIVQSQTP